MADVLNAKMRGLLAIILTVVGIAGSVGTAYAVLKSDIARNSTRIDHGDRDRELLRKNVVEALRRIEAEQREQRADIKALLRKDGG